MTTRKLSDEAPPLKVHFMAHIGGDHTLYKRIVDLIKRQGHKLVIEHALTRTIEEVERETEEESKRMANNLIEWVLQADVVVYEVSMPEVSLGYEMAVAFTHYIPVIVLYHQRHGTVPQGLKGMDKELLQVQPYTEESLPEILKESFDYARGQLEHRSYISLTQPMRRYLDWVKRTHHLDYSTYMRVLIERDMNANAIYQTLFKGKKLI